MSDDLLPQYDPPPLEPPDWVYCFWEITIPLGIVIFIAAAIVISLR